ncbi:MAG: hypothetical protein ACRD9R_21840 [Pyrinomonadaceae bacterium]
MKPVGAARRFAAAPPRHSRKWRVVVAVLFVTLAALAPAAARAQQPFYTDDTDVTERGRFHFEFSNQFDLLQRDAFPNLKQNTASFELAYGLFRNVEISIETPLIKIFNAREASPRTVFGVGDTNLSVKYNFRQEREGSRLPALTVSGSVELPTGDTSRQLGSGIADFSVNGVAQKSLTIRTKLRLNGGVIFSGNTVTGAVGIRGARGTVFTGGVSFVRDFTERLALGAELTGARTRNFDLGKGQLQTQVGGNYALRDGFTLDFGLIVGRYSASPRLGAQLGISVDF